MLRVLESVNFKKLKRIQVFAEPSAKLVKIPQKMYEPNILNKPTS